MKARKHGRHKRKKGLPDTKSRSVAVFQFYFYFRYLYGPKENKEVVSGPEVAITLLMFFDPELLTINSMKYSYKLNPAVCGSW